MSLQIDDKYLPYHKHDRENAAGAIYQISNSGEIRIIHSLDFAKYGKAVLGELTFIKFDYNYDGFNINQYKTAYASIIGTADPSGGIQYFIANKSEIHNNKEKGLSLPCPIRDAWGLWNKEQIFSNDAKKGSHVFRLNIIRDRAPDSSNFSCPNFYNDAFTAYEIIPNFTFASGKIITLSKQQVSSSIVKKHIVLPLVFPLLTLC